LNATASIAPSAGTGERGFVEQRERRAVRHTAADTFQFEFDQTATARSQSRDDAHKSAAERILT